MLQSNVDVVIFTDSVRVKTLGPYRLATELRIAGYTCQIIDNLTFITSEEVSKILSIVVGPNTKVVGLSFTFVNVKQLDSRLTKPMSEYVKEQFSDSTSGLYMLMHQAKEINPNVKVIVGGAMSRLLINYSKFVDMIFIGPSDAAIVEYLNFLTNKVVYFSGISSVNKTVKIVDGLHYNNKFDVTQSRVIYHPSDNIAYQEILPIEIGRGCIFKCKFCSYPFIGKKKNDYIKHSSVLREEFIRNYNEHGTTKYVYVDDTHNESVEKLTMMANVVQSLPFELHYVSYIRLDLLRSHPEQYQLLKDGGLKGCFFGIESLNYESAKAIGKGLHTDSVIEELHKFRSIMLDVTTTGGFICGLPYETEESMVKWSSMVKDESFPLDSVIMSPLYITSPAKSNDELGWKSEFSKNSSEYYTWDSNNEWHNGNFSAKWAQDFSQEFMSSIIESGRQKVAGVTDFMMQNIGFTDPERVPINQICRDAVEKLRMHVLYYKRRLFMDVGNSAKIVDLSS